MYLLGQLSLWLRVKSVQNTMFRLKTLRIFTKCMSYLPLCYQKMWLWDMTYLQ